MFNWILLKLKEKNNILLNYRKKDQIYDKRWKMFSWFRNPYAQTHTI